MIHLIVLMVYRICNPCVIKRARMCVKSVKLPLCAACPCFAHTDPVQDLTYLYERNALIFQLNAMKRRISIILVAIIMCAVNSRAYTVRPIHSTTSEIVTAIHQDPMNFIWFGGSGGLNRFDGYSTVGFHDGNAEDRIGYINGVYPGADDNYFLLATKNGLYRYDYRTGVSSIACDRLHDVDVRAYVAVPDGMVYVGTDCGVYILSPELHVVAVVDKAAGLGSDHVNVLCLDRDGNLIVGHRRGMDILRYDGADVKVCRHQVTEGGVRIILTDMNDNIWYNVNNKIYWAPRQAWLEEPERSSHLISGNLECVTALECRDQIWVGTRGGGVLRYSVQPDETAPRQLPSLFLNNADRSEINNSVVSLFRDAGGDVWIGTMNGVYLYTDVDNSFNLLHHDPNNVNSPSIDIISSIHIDGDDTVWLGTSYGINRMVWDAEKANYTITKYVDHSESNDFVGNNRILMIAPCGAHRFLISTKLSLKLFDTVTGQFESTVDLDAVYSRYGMRYVRSYCQSPDGNIYMAFNQGGIGVWDASKGIVVPIMWEGHARDTHRAIVRDSAGRLWVAADGRGVWCLTLSPDGLGVASECHYDRHCFGSQDITALHVDSAHRIWAGTFSGLYMMDHEGEFTEVDMFGPRFYVSSITEDLAHNIWVSSIKGVYKIASRDVVNYFEIDGPGDIAKLWYIIGHGIDAEGTVYLGGISGLIYFNPGAVGAPGRPTFTRLSGIEIDNRPDLATAQALNAGHHVRFGSGTGSVRFEFTALNYTDPNTARYLYKLEGRDKDYTRVDAYHRAVTYSGLPPGDYVLKVKSSTPSADRYGDETCFSFTVERSAATSWWAIVIYMAAGVAMVWTVWRIVMGRLRRNRENRLYRLKILNFVSINNKLRVPLTSLQAPVEHLMARCSESGDEEIKGMLDVMRKNIRRMSDQIDDFIEFSSSDAADSRLHLQHIGIDQLITGVFNSLSERAAIRGLGYTMALGEADIKLFVDVPKLEVALFNLLSCAIGSSPEGGSVEVRGSIDRRHNSYVLTISDSSRIWSKAKDIYTCRDLFHIAVAKDFVEMHRSRFRIRRAADGTGTVYEIRLPLGLSHYSGEQLDALDMSAGTMAQSAYIRRNTSADMHEQPELSERTEMPDRTVVAAVAMDADLFRMLGVELSGEYMLRALAFNKDMVHMLKRFAPGCVIVEASEISMVEEFMAQIRRDAMLSGVPVVVVSANSDPEFEHACYAAGIALWIRQPLDLRYMHTRIDNLIATHRKIEEVVTRKLIVNPREVNVLTSNEVFLANVMEVIERNIGNERFTVDMLAADLNISNSVLYRRLKQLTDLSPVNFIRSVRLKRAAQLLRTGRYLVSEVCQMVGFSDQRYFSSCFKRQYGRTPKAWSMQSPDS